MVCIIWTLCMCICTLSTHKSVCSPTDPAIPCSGVDVIILFVHMFIIYCLFTIFCQLSVTWHSIYGMFLCITNLDVIMSVHVCFFSPLWRVFSWCFNILSVRSSMSSKLIPETLFSCEGCYFNMFVVTMWPVIVFWIVYDLLLWWLSPMPELFHGFMVLNPLIG